MTAVVFHEMPLKIINMNEISSIKKELEMWYSTCDSQGGKGVDVKRVDELWERLCSLDKENIEYKLGFAMFLVGYCDYDYEKAISILAPLRNDARCVIIRCAAAYWWAGDDDVINDFDFERLLQLAKTRQEKSLMCLYKSRAAGSDRLAYLCQSINWFPYNYNSIIEILKITDKQDTNYTMYKNMLLQCEKMIFRIYPINVGYRFIYYKPYLYWEMGLANIMWSSVVENRGKLGFAKDELPPIDVTPFVDDKYFKDTLNRCSNFTHLKNNNEVW